MTEERMKRIGELARKSKSQGLTEAEKEEQAQLRAEYIADFRKNFMGIMDNTYIQTPDGQKKKVTRKTESGK